MFNISKESDLRVIKTKKLIKEAFFELMESIGFEKITIAELAKKAMVSRTTFYLHYMDKYDLLDKLENDVLDELTALMKASHCSIVTIVKSDDLDIISNFIKRYYLYVKENEQFFRLIMSDKGDSAFQVKLNDIMKENISEVIGEYKFAVPLNYAVSFMVGAQVSITKEWISAGMNETPEEMARILSVIMNDIPRKILI